MTSAYWQLLRWIYFWYWLYIQFLTHLLNMLKTYMMLGAKIKKLSRWLLVFKTPLFEYLWLCTDTCKKRSWISLVCFGFVSMSICVRIHFQPDPEWELCKVTRQKMTTESSFISLCLPKSHIWKLKTKTVLVKLPKFFESYPQGKENSEFRFLFFLF
jgi:hypothetical protein